MTERAWEWQMFSDIYQKTLLPIPILRPLWVVMCAYEQSSRQCLASGVKPALAEMQSMLLGLVEV